MSCCLNSWLRPLILDSNMTANEIASQAWRSCVSSLKIFTLSFLDSAKPNTHGPERGSRSGSNGVAHAFSWFPVCRFVAVWAEEGRLSAHHRGFFARAAPCKPEVASQFHRWNAMSSPHVQNAVNACHCQRAPTSIRGLLALAINRNCRSLSSTPLSLVRNNISLHD